MELDQGSSKPAVSCPAPSQGVVKTWLPSKRGAANPKTVADLTLRFQGDGVRYKAKLIGVDPVPEPQGDKMCLDSMMKLKGQEVAARNQGKHKQRVWLKISTSGLKIIDERTGVLAYEHEGGRISHFRKDECDPRALAYVYQYEASYQLFYIKTANPADPVLDDIREVCQSLDQGTQEDQVTHGDTPATNDSLLLLDEDTGPTKALDGLDMFNPVPSSPMGQPSQMSSRDELMDIFSVCLEDPAASSQNPGMNQPGSPQQTPSFSQMFSPQPPGGSPFTSPTSMPWGQQGPLTSLQHSSGAPWGAPPLGPWPTQPAMTAWSPQSLAPHGGAQMQAYGAAAVPSPWGLLGQNTVPCPPAASYVPYGGGGCEQPVFPTATDKHALG